MNADVARLFVDTQIILIEVEGMKAENQQCGFHNERPSYTEDEFFEKTKELKAISEELGNINDSV